MAAGLQEWMSEIAAAPDEFQKMMLAKDGRRAATAKAGVPERAQLRKLSRAQLRQH
jgi:hypothetical protein